MIVRVWRRKCDLFFLFPLWKSSSLIFNDSIYLKKIFLFSFFYYVKCCTKWISYHLIFYYRNMSCLFILSSIAILVQIIISTNPLYHFCSKSENLTFNSYYAQNLKNLLGNLYLKPPQQASQLAHLGKIMIKQMDFFYVVAIFKAKITNLV